MKRDVTEFEGTLKETGAALCVTLGEAGGLELGRYGFKPGQAVLVSVTPGRVEIRRQLPSEVVEELDRAAEELRSLRERIQFYVQELPPAAAGDAEDSPEEATIGTLECLISDDLGPAIEKLESIARLRPEAPPSRPEARRRRRAKTKPGEAT